MVTVETVDREILKQNKEFKQHKKVVRFNDIESGLKGFIAIHNDNLGEAVGGTRMFPYVSELEALNDVLRLSRAMTYKCALAGLHQGGGKGVIIGNPNIEKSKNLLQAYADVINQLAGSFHTGEDVGMSEEDVKFMLDISPYFIGKPGQAQDPSPFASLSTFYSIQEIARLVFGTDSLRGRTVAIKGVGKVGGELARLLNKEGACLVIADVDKIVVEKLQQEISGIKVVSPDVIHSQEVDFYSPCALSNEFTQKTAAEVRAKIICGAANSQLEDDSIGDWLFSQNIVYVPDYIANSGGLIDVADELEEGGFNRERVLERIAKVKNVVRNVFEFSRSTHKPPNRVADLIAEDLFQK